MMEDVNWKNWEKPLTDSTCCCMTNYHLILRVPGEDILLNRSDNLVSLLEKRDVLNGDRPGLPCFPLTDNCEAVVLADTYVIPSMVVMDWCNVEDSECPEYVAEVF